MLLHMWNQSLHAHFRTSVSINVWITSRSIISEVIIIIIVLMCSKVSWFWIKSSDSWTVHSKTNKKHLIHSLTCWWKVRWSFLIHKKSGASESSMAAFSKATQINLKSQGLLMSCDFLALLYCFRRIVEHLFCCEAPEMSCVLQSFLQFWSAWSQKIMADLFFCFWVNCSSKLKCKAT